jgi:hypothetical protein
LEAFLSVNGVGYVFLGLVCLLCPGRAARLIGLELEGEKGLAEFSAVYGGLELGLGAFYLNALLYSAWHPALLMFSLCLYGGIVGARIISIFWHGRRLGIVWGLFALETLMFAWAAVLFQGAR